MVKAKVKMFIQIIYYRGTATLTKNGKRESEPVKTVHVLSILGTCHLPNKFFEIGVFSVNNILCPQVKMFTFFPQIGNIIPEFFFGFSHHNRPVAGCVLQTFNQGFAADLQVDYLTVLLHQAHVVAVAGNTSAG